MSKISGLKSLFKDAVIYGLSSILGRFLNYLLVPIYTRVLIPGDYGIVTNLYAYTALLLALLTFGMETTYFRFFNRKDVDKPMQVYANALIFLVLLTTLFVVGGFVFLQPISDLLGYAAHTDFVAMVIVMVALDAVTSLPFARLRCEEKAWKFAGIKLSNIALNMFLNIFFLLICPVIYKHSPDSISWFYNPQYGVGYIFVSNVITSLYNVLMLRKEFRGFDFNIDRRLMSRMLRYAFPILCISVAGILNQSVDKILFPFLYADAQEATAQLGIYGACFKIAVIMVMFIQAYRYAIEPFIFKRSERSDVVETNAVTTLYFLIFSLFIYLLVAFYLEDIFKLLVSPAYYEGLKVVPIVMVGEMMFGMYFNLAFWFKLNDQTYWGTLFTVIGCIITITIICVFVPTYGYIACAWATVACNGVMLLMSYFVGRYRYPIPYPLRKMAIYVILTALLYVVGMYVLNATPLMRLVWRSLLLVVFAIAVIRIENLTPALKGLLHRNAR